MPNSSALIAWLEVAYLLLVRSGIIVVQFWHHHPRLLLVASSVEVRSVALLAQDC